MQEIKRGWKQEPQDYFPSHDLMRQIYPCLKSEDSKSSGVTWLHLDEAENDKAMKKRHNRIKKQEYEALQQLHQWEKEVYKRRKERLKQEIRLQVEEDRLREQYNKLLRSTLNSKCDLCCSESSISSNVTDKLGKDKDIITSKNTSICSLNKKREMELKSSAKLLKKKLAEQKKSEKELKKQYNKEQKRRNKLFKAQEKEQKKMSFKYPSGPTFKNQQNKSLECLCENNQKVSNYCKTNTTLNQKSALSMETRSSGPSLRNFKSVCTPASPETSNLSREDSKYKAAFVSCGTCPDPPCEDLGQIFYTDTLRSRSSACSDGSGCKATHCEIAAKPCDSLLQGGTYKVTLQTRIA